MSISFRGECSLIGGIGLQLVTKRFSANGDRVLARILRMGRKPPHVTIFFVKLNPLLALRLQTTHIMIFTWLLLVLIV